MKSIPLALTWEFWRQIAAQWAITIVSLAGLMAWLCGDVRFENVVYQDSVMLTGLHAFCFMFIVVGLAAVVCNSTAAATQRFTLPVSVRLSVFIPMLNGVLATVLGYLAIALLANGLFNAQWTLIKPMLIAVCVVTVCQAACALNWQSPQLRAALAAGLAGVIGVGLIFPFGNYRPEQFHGHWQTIQPTDICLAVIIPVLAYTYSVATLALARHGTELSLAALGRWLLVSLRFDLRLYSKPRGTTPMSAELWIDWITRGIGLPAGAILVGAVICGFLISGRFDWQSARGMIIALTWVQVFIAPAFGLFIGNVGNRFDYNEYSATRPLSDMQLADVKLRNLLKAVCWMWIFWAIGLAFGVVCLTIVGQGPKSWSDIVAPGTRPLAAIIGIGTVPLGSFTLMSLGVSVAILRPWMVKTVCRTLVLLPAVPFGLLYLMPWWENEIFAVARWVWICLTIGGTVAIYATAFRLRLISAKRLAIVGIAYLLICAAGLTWLCFLPPIVVASPLVVGFLLSSCILPFVCVAAVPLAIWWNRHR